jgi:hypothetical protein
MKSPRKWFYEKIDNYIIKHHSDEYIRRCLIQDEIERWIKVAVTQNDTMRDKQEKSKLDAQKLKFDIQESGWCAEITNMEKAVADVMVLRDNVMKLYFTTYQRAKELAMVTAENKHEGTNIINSVAASVGKLDVIGARAEATLDEMVKNKDADELALRIK